MTFLTIPEGHTERLTVSPGQPEQVHVFDQPSIDAVNAALAAGRPLLVLGEPGTGKSQLARAVAQRLGRVFLHRVVDARTEAQDLLWHFDAVNRLAEAQLAGALKGDDSQAVRDRLALRNFLSPGPLWWALNWHDAAAQAKICQLAIPGQIEAGDPAKDSDLPKPDPIKNGCVVLIDEIDKAEPELPNGLLEVMGNGEFSPPGLPAAVKAAEPSPLIIITSNEERTLPAAFLRRCLALRLSLPDARDALITQLIARGKAHFNSPDGANTVDDTVLDACAKLLADDRAKAPDPKPGQAEYLDLVRAVTTLGKQNVAAQMKLIDQIAPYVLKSQARQP